MTNVSLRPIQPADLEILFLQQLVPEATAMAGVPAKDRELFFSRWKEWEAKPDVIRLAIDYGGTLAGYVGSFERDGLRETCWWLGKEFWGRGIAKKALALFLQRFDKRPLWAVISKGNAASRKVAESCGFTLQGEKTSANGGDPAHLFKLEAGPR